MRGRSEAEPAAFRRAQANGQVLCSRACLATFGNAGSGKLRKVFSQFCRPEDVILPADYQQPVGLLSAEQLAAQMARKWIQTRVSPQPILSHICRYDAENADRRYLLSVYGNIFDVSDRRLEACSCMHPSPREALLDRSGQVRSRRPIR